ncbi:hypothetical protein [Cellulomonas fimi]|uniref:Lipoprotein n=1 Tax=Cellulomonas fimi (strain ATCC 484 / DSM 20113 / JCM 1341 / CCUG 24087 / LMG 16345 / NBRC 15513 / NCIMB 8980 / NCTC 7547 / NRS-133) TaxID=590998 RepID=F4H381_CELFA|nr:hypothetical protein [Cellulomonas fimi]AEE45302.1 hypothetical protein Celf_1167 [Cellulomonas fimi ATCC 484]NNH07914.1 hypothetical protein [Cellulomonas fimi]VEH28878.1 Uncharacterised protein [Cellulomonas fimi]
MRRQPALAVTHVVTVAVTAGCSDRSPDGFAVVNESDTAVSVSLVGAAAVEVGAGRRAVVETEDCLGTGVVVAADGPPAVEIDGPACVASVRHVRADHTADVSSMHG